MARFEGTFEEFNEYYGPKIRNLVANMTKSEKNTLGNTCQICDEIKSSLDAAHKHGMERKTLMRKALEKYSKRDNWYVVDNLGKLLSEIKELHMPILDIFLFLCRDCHRKYDDSEKSFKFDSKKPLKPSDNIELTDKKDPPLPSSQSISVPDSHCKIPCKNPKHDWDVKLVTTSTFNRKNINDLISMINSRFDCRTCEFKSWYFHDCMHNNRQFSGIICHKSRSEICFRICRDSFDIEDNRVRKPNATWFFPRRSRKTH